MSARGAQGTRMALGERRESMNTSSQRSRCSGPNSHGVKKVPERKGMQRPPTRETRGAKDRSTRRSTRRGFLHALCSAMWYMRHRSRVVLSVVREGGGDARGGTR
jgi:hypothetical protein